MSTAILKLFIACRDPSLGFTEGAARFFGRCCAPRICLGNCRVSMENQMENRKEHEVETTDYYMLGF